ncbi:MAG: RHS repeat-associated core domain-containing protein [Eubacterium sp.]
MLFISNQQLTVSSRTSFNDDYNHSGILPIGSYTTFIIYNELGEAVGFAVDDGTNIKIYYYMKDITGQIDAVVDVETNTIVYSCTYDAWGFILDEYCTDALVAYGNPLRYKEYNYDINSDLYYLQSRYYDAEIGRFINADDPILSDTGTKNSLSTNMYVYCESDPVNKIDPTGKFVLLLILSIVLVKQNIINILSPYKKQITVSNDYGYSCKYKGKIEIDMQNSGFARDIYDIYRTYKSKSLYNSLLFDVLTEFCNEKFNKKFRRNIIFDDLGISNEIKEHVLGYLWAIGYSVTPPPLMYAYCKGSKSKMKEHCKKIDINESDVYNVIQRTNFAYFSHIRFEYMSSRKDPFYYPSTHVRIAVPNNNWKSVEMK